MKIVFEGSELKEGIIKVSLDGGFTFTDYEIADVKESGIPLDDSQRYDKIKIKGPANVLKSLDIVSNVKVEGGQSVQKDPDYDTRIEWYAWKPKVSEIGRYYIYTKECPDSGTVIPYDRHQITKEPPFKYDYVEKNLETHRYEIVENTLRVYDLMAEIDEEHGVFNYVEYVRYPEGDVVVKEPKKTSFYSWRIVKGRLLQTDGVLVNPGITVGILYTTKNPETDHAPYVFYKKDTDNNMSIEFIHNEEISRELEGTQFAGAFAFFTGYDGDYCEIMFNGNEAAEKLGVEMASVPVEAIGKEKPFLYIQYDEGYVGYQNRGKPFACVIFNREGINKAFGYEVSRVIFKVLSKDVTDKFIYDESLLVSDKITVISTHVLKAPMNQDWDVGDFEAVLYDDHKVVRYPLRVGNVFEERNEELELLN